MSQSQENFQTEGWKDRKTERRTLIHRTLPATAGGPTKALYQLAALSKLVHGSSLKSKNLVFKASQRSVHDMAGQPNIPKVTTDRIIAFLERPDISYCKPDHKETVHCGKDLNEESVYKPKHSLLWTLHEILNQFDLDESFTLTYYTLQKIVSEQKHYPCRRETAKDDCCCEKCENNKLLLTALQKKLASNQIQNFAEIVKIDPGSFIESLICFIKNYDCCRRNCKSCVGPAECQELIITLKPWKKFNIVNGYISIQALNLLMYLLKYMKVTINFMFIMFVVNIPNLHTLNKILKKMKRFQCRL